MRAAILIQRWYRQYVSRMEMRRRHTWNIFQSIEYAGEQDQVKLYNFLGYLMDNFTPSSSERNLISHIFRENEVCRDPEWERYFCYKNIDVPAVYSGPRLIFPITIDQAAGLVEAFKNKQQLHSRYVLQLLLETWKLLRMLPNINRISTCHSKEITICGDLHGQLEDLLLIFYKNGMPSLDTPYVFNGDFVDRGKDSIEILLILFAFMLVYPGDVHLNRGNHEDHIINLRYGFTREVLGKYKLHGKRILKLLQKIFSWLPLATVIDQKVLIVHGGLSDMTDLAVISRVDRHRVSWRYDAGRWPLPMLVTASHNSSSAPLSPLNSNPVPRTALTPPMMNGNRQVSHLSEILDLLWSDPMDQDGCIANEVRGCGCYWGPDMTEKFLNKHNLQLIIRSHECKQEGYEFCHNRKVLTLFSASNYYEVGSNRGAYIRLGPDLVPYFIQYQASDMTRELTLRQSVGRTERSALKALREQLFAHKTDLLSAFQEFDKENTGMISLNNWATAVGNVLHLDLPWRTLRSQLVTTTLHDMLDYQDWFQELAIKEPSHVDQTVLDTLYRHRSTLETIFRIVDTDNSGLISFEDFRQTWKLLSAFLKMEITDEAISDLVVSIDTNKDGSIDIDEFMEAFRLVDRSSAPPSTASARIQCSSLSPKSSGSDRSLPSGKVGFAEGCLPCCC
uniref:Serine/threonine-protein phosphatase with EF-hands n=1 Tax=Denticeps clupeoides TaxID=299321 RepID=A0AAY4C3K2_9TELE